MSTLFDLVVKGGPTMIPMVGLSIATVSCALERGWFWFQLMQGEERVAHDVLEASRYSLEEARAIAEQHQSTPIGRFLLAPLRLNQPTPETFNLALEAAGEQEFVQMRKGDKLLETVVAIAPLLGLLGTVTGLIVTFMNLNIGGSAAGGAGDVSKAAGGIAEALITTASGMIVAIVALAAFRVSVTLQTRQMDYFSKVGSELELIYRQAWYEPTIGEGLRPEPVISSRS
ncbi:MotA/TolQ/ExbB proton channel family protein [Kovacikia minuta CCNUW1]|uniref:MotA/TolQ/ExbB proton channel family protein n=1 Tax=Kovacikia minuta TaxID=2931930 RepID=UPI001CCE2651|nr:MotA/TolQ/ExbB proton channel family protein [Kovacikia minuta]UBF27267.1 MotA/TolQ/ExbB proton channel family protein [Kovacikia minuta CCNUW1]